MEKGVLKMNRKAVFLDRDGVLIYDSGYLKEISQVKILAHVFSALKRMQELGFLLVIISNQSVVARGLSSEEEVGRIDSYIKGIFRRKEIVLEKSYYCFHHPDYTGACDCRKPEPGLFLKARKDLGINIVESWVIGDKITDMQAGKRAGCENLICLPTNLTSWDRSEDSGWIGYRGVNNLSQAVEIIQGVL